MRHLIVLFVAIVLYVAAITNADVVGRAGWWVALFGVLWLTEAHRHFKRKAWAVLALETLEMATLIVAIVAGFNSPEATYPESTYNFGGGWILGWLWCRIREWRRLLEKEAETVTLKCSICGRECSCVFRRFKIDGDREPNPAILCSPCSGVGCYWCRKEMEKKAP